MKASVESKGEIKIPTELRRELDISDGDEVSFTKTEYGYIFNKVGKESVCPVCGEKVSISDDHTTIDKRLYHLSCGNKVYLRSLKI